MPKTAIGLFENADVADAAVREIETLGLPRNEIRILGEPLDFAVTGVTSMPHLDFEVELTRELMRIGTTKPEAEAYLDGVRRRGVLVFATGPADKVDAATEIMNRRNAIESEEVSGPEPDLSIVNRGSASHERAASVQAGRIRQPGGAIAFAW
jgi:hypothetical protein